MLEVELKINDEKEKPLKGFRMLLKIIMRIMRTLVITQSMTQQC